MLVWNLLAAATLCQAAGPSAAGQFRAQEIARRSPRLQRQLAELTQEARRIRDPRLRALALDTVEGPSFSGLLARRSDETEIVARLHQEGLLDASVAKIFPDGRPGAFFASPGSVWQGHHSYPGGLIDHTLFNLAAGLGYVAAYKRVYGIALDADLVRAAAIAHDAAKAWDLPWSADGTVPAAEVTIAGTGAHHILGAAEALSRGWPARAIVVLASAHSPPHPGPELKALLGYLRAAAIIAGKPYAAAGLTPDGSALARPAPMEAFVNHLDDHDWVLSETTIKADAPLLPANPWARDEKLAQTGDIPIYRAYLDQPAR